MTFKVGDKVKTRTDFRRGGIYISKGTVGTVQKVQGKNGNPEYVVGLIAAGGSFQEIICYQQELAKAGFFS